MQDYRAVMTLLIRKRSYRQIEDQLGCSHRAISRANQALRSLGLTTAQQVAALTNDELDETVSYTHLTLPTKRIV